MQMSIEGSKKVTYAEKSGSDQIMGWRYHQTQHRQNRYRNRKLGLLN
jgi:hypothetical protein